jgi:nitrate reductase NapE component
MDRLYAWVYLCAAIVGLIPAAYGGWLLLTGRSASAGRGKTWRRSTDAGMFYLAFGLWPVLQTVGFFGVHRNFFSLAIAWALMVLGLAMVAVAIIRYRPRSVKSAT